MAIEKEPNQKQEERLSTILEDLTSLENYIKDLFSFLPTPICLISPIGIVLEVNPAFEKTSGFKVEDIIGQPIDKIFEKSDIENLISETSKEGFINNKELYIFTKDQKKIPVSVSTVLRKSEEDEVIGYFFAMYNLSETKIAEKEIKDTQIALLNILEDTDEAKQKAEEERSKTLAIFNNFSDGLLMLDNKSYILLINPEAEKYFNITGRTIIGKSIFDLAGDPFFKPLLDILGKEIKEVFRKEFVLEKITLEASSAPVLREKEKLGTLIIIHDITREKMIEKMKTEFVSIAAHQLRTPLSAIKWTLRMILDGDIGDVTKEQREFIEKTYISNERMINLINDLLDVTRIEEGRYIYKPAPSDFLALVQFVINIYKEEINKKNLKFNFIKPNKPLPKIKMDVEKMRVVVQNLLDNSVKYTSPGGEITITLKQSKKEIEFSIKDTGAGIPKDQQNRVFTKFFRGANVLRMDTEGSGFGLFIIKNIIEAHEGKIWFESEENKGTTFYFTLPIKEEFTEFLKGF